jgi:hypothetical protein
LGEAAVWIVLNETGFKSAQCIKIALDAVNLLFRRRFGGGEERYADQGKHYVRSETYLFKFIVYPHISQLGDAPKFAT